MKSIPVTLDIYDDGENRVVEVTFTVTKEEKTDSGLKRVWLGKYKEQHWGDPIEVEVIEMPEGELKYVDKPSTVSTSDESIANQLFT